MRYMFYFCSSLISLPNISEWNTSKVSNMSSMFSECNSLLNLPDMKKPIIYIASDYNEMNACVIY